MRVLDAVGGFQVATLVRGRMVDRLTQHGMKDRLYIAMTCPDWHPVPPHQHQRGEAYRELVAYEVGSWRELGRGAGDRSMGIATTPW